jgi:hypothetical protein
MFDLEKPDTREAYVAQWFPCGELQKSGVTQDLATNDALLGRCLTLAERSVYGSTVCISITSYADHSDRLKYRSRPDDQGWIIGA